MNFLKQIQSLPWSHLVLFSGHCLSGHHPSRGCVSLPQSPQGILHVLVSQAVDEGVEHRDDQGVEDRDHLALLQGLHSSRLGIHDKKGPIKEGNGCHVGAKGGEELVSPSSWAHPQDGHCDVAIGDDDHECGAHDEEATEAKHDQLIGRSVSTGELEQRRHITEEGVDVVGAAEREAECEAGLQDGVEAASAVGDQHQEGTDRGAHGDGVVQGATDGHKAIIGHHGQE